ncbi:MAG: AzlD domain-containing protein [Alphaproteobacteria bacterium]|nr:AzlD domain-containing protein [Alphaproteobacteria bacterium]
MIWIAIIISGLFTFLTRFAFIGGLSGRQLPPSVRSLLAYVTTAVLTALIASDVLIIDHQFNVTENPQVPALIIAGIVALLFRNIVLTIAVGLLALWVSRHMIFI